MRRGAWRHFLFLGSALIGAVAGPGLAQTNDELNAGLQFSFAPPGARSLAMGGAFSGLADDATAAYANPAGLVWLSRPEISLEGRHRNYKTLYPDIGNASGEPQGIGLDVLDTLVFSESVATTQGLSFASYVYPWRRRWRFALYQHQLADFRATVLSQGPFIRRTTASGEARSRLPGIQGDLTLEVKNTGFSTAYQATENFWIGLGLSAYEFTLDAISHRYETVLPRGGNSQAFFFHVAPIPKNERDRHVQSGDDSAVAGHFGLLLKDANNRFSLGLVYHQSPRFAFSYSYAWGEKSIANAAGDPNNDGIIDASPNLDYVDPGIVRALSGRSTFAVPDVLSLGFAWKPEVAWTLSAEVTHVRYSRLEPKSNILFSGLENPNSCGDFDLQGTPQDVPCRSSASRLERFVIDDANELHLGVEYVFRGRTPLALRLGAWFDPDHQLRFAGTGPPPEDRFEAPFGPGSDEIHTTGGLGIVLGGKFQIDVGFDFSARADLASLSSVYRF